MKQWTAIISLFLDEATVERGPDKMGAQLHLVPKGLLGMRRQWQPFCSPSASLHLIWISQTPVLNFLSFFTFFFPPFFWEKTLRHQPHPAQHSCRLLWCGSTSQMRTNLGSNSLVGPSWHRVAHKGVRTPVQLGSLLQVHCRGTRASPLPQPLLETRCYGAAYHESICLAYKLCINGLLLFSFPWPLSTRESSERELLGAWTVLVMRSERSARALLQINK